MSMQLKNVTKRGLSNFVRATFIAFFSASNICTFLPAASASPSFLISAHLMSTFSEMEFSFADLKYSFLHYYHQKNLSFSTNTTIFKDSIPSYNLSSRFEVEINNSSSIRLSNEFQTKNVDTSENERSLYSAIASFTCVSLSSTYDPTTMCSGLVGYSFYMPQSSNLSSLDHLARKKAKGLISFINTACLADMKRLICASVYKQCVSNGILDVVCSIL
jgi:hypothetical protein